MFSRCTQRRRLMYRSTIGTTVDKEANVRTPSRAFAGAAAALVAGALVLAAGSGGRAPPGEGSVVLFRQRFGDLAAAVDGMLSVGVRAGQVWHVSSSLARDAATPEPAILTAAQAEAVAVRDAGAAG